MRLELEMIEDSDATKSLKSDITEMEHMLEAYLSFARGEGHEKPTLTNLSTLIESVIQKSKKEGRSISFYEYKKIMLPIRLFNEKESDKYFEIMLISMQRMLAFRFKKKEVD